MRAHLLSLMGLDYQVKNAQSCIESVLDSDLLPIELCNQWVEQIISRSDLLGQDRIIIRPPHLKPEKVICPVWKGLVNKWQSGEDRTTRAAKGISQEAEARFARFTRAVAESVNGPQIDFWCEGWAEECETQYNDLLKLIKEVDDENCYKNS